MANYSVVLTRTASTTLSLGSITADATRPRRGKLYEFQFGSHATPADNPFLYVIQRCTAAGTSTAVTPQAIDPADVATETDAGENHTVEPTYTANAILFKQPINQRSAYRWAAIRPGKELVWPATASNGVGIQTPTSTAVVIHGQVFFEEQ